MSSRTIMIKKSDLKMWCLSALVFFCAFDNTFIRSFIDISNVKKLLGIGIIGFHLILIFIGKSKHKFLFRQSIILYFIFYAWILFLSIENNGMGQAYDLLYANFGSILIFLFVQYYSYNDKKIMNILDTWKYLILILVLIDLLTLFLYPNGLYSSVWDSNNWFLGYKTSRVLYSLPMCAMFFYTSIRRNRKISFQCWIVLLISAWDAFLSQATSASVALVVCGLFVLLINNNVFTKFLNWILNIKVWYIIYFVLVFLIVVSQSTGLLSFLADLLGKDATFTGRTLIWLSCIDSIISSRGLGIGYLSSEGYSDLTNWVRGTNAHNHILGLLVTGGVAAFFIYYYMIYRTTKKSYIQDVIRMYIYGMMVLGITSDTITYSMFGFFMIWLLEYSGERGYDPPGLLSSNCELQAV